MRELGLLRVEGKLFLMPYMTHRQIHAHTCSHTNAHLHMTAVHAHACVHSSQMHTHAHTYNTCAYTYMHVGTVYSHQYPSTCILACSCPHYGSIVSFRCLTISFLSEKMPLKWLMNHQQVIIMALMYVLLDLSNEVGNLKYVSVHN